MSHQIDVHMVHDGEHQYDELDDDPKCTFQPARHPNACERPSSQHERYLINARVAGPPRKFLHSYAWTWTTPSTVDAAVERTYVGNTHGPQTPVSAIGRGRRGRWWRAAARTAAAALRECE